MIAQFATFGARELAINSPIILGGLLALHYEGAVALGIYASAAALTYGVLRLGGGETHV